MSIDVTELRNFVIRPTLKHLNVWSTNAENLLLGTAALESGLGSHLKEAYHQGLGIYAITPEVHKQLWDEYLVGDVDLASEIRGLASQHEFLEHPHQELTTNLSYATAIAWYLYEQNGLKLPKRKCTLDALAHFWYQHYWHHTKNRDMNKFKTSYARYMNKMRDAAA